MAQLRKWAEDEPPRAFWLGGLTSPLGFLTALLQQAAPKLGRLQLALPFRRAVLPVPALQCLQGVPIDALGWEFPVVAASENQITTKPKEGAYIKDLYLENARWDPEGFATAVLVVDKPLIIDAFSLQRRPWRRLPGRA